MQSVSSPGEIKKILPPLEVSCRIRLLEIVRTFVLRVGHVSVTFAQFFWRLITCPCSRQFDEIFTPFRAFALRWHMFGTRSSIQNRFYKALLDVVNEQPDSSSDVLKNLANAIGCMLERNREDEMLYCIAALLSALPKCESDTEAVNLLCDSVNKLLWRIHLSNHDDVCDSILSYVRKHVSDAATYRLLEKVKNGMVRPRSFIEKNKYPMTLPSTIVACEGTPELQVILAEIMQKCSFGLKSREAFSEVLSILPIACNDKSVTDILGNVAGNLMNMAMNGTEFVESFDDILRSIEYESNNETGFLSLGDKMRIVVGGRSNSEAIVRSLIIALKTAVIQIPHRLSTCAIYYGKYKSDLSLKVDLESLKKRVQECIKRCSNNAELTLALENVVKKIEEYCHLEPEIAENPACIYDPFSKRYNSIFHFSDYQIVDDV
ncbi:MAG: hypothetical protein LBP65_02490 [Puniceicoccales bacterium]|jgi:hypothetical protein|nr:hypothetical protein [Puniceicoccales bacterium]